MRGNKKPVRPQLEGDPTDLLPLPPDIGLDPYEPPPPPPLPPYTPPATVEELLAKCEDYRAGIIDARLKEREFVTVADRDRLRKGELKVLPHDGYFLPKLELFWLAGLTLGLPDGPRFPGEPVNALEAVAALDTLMQWCRSKQQPASASTTSSDSKRKLKEPSKEAIACYRLQFATGAKQTELAKRLSIEFGRPVNQPQVSRWIKEVKEWLKAGNILPGFAEESRPMPGRTTRTYDPRIIDQGVGQQKSIRRSQKDYDD